ncbi:clathrin adaptor, mu subunit [Suhomyces tanzawaensis NRRL Y-17324]|uniref:Clathrin adaptor, mu subunit n=1 Tax=Suhomyces tanzawaensis NRRL Y-17324 TaxID=984487 RepID=A0A1E4SJN5_9ASCO|nr:clathrin adaptor, mu subunit [Suhomyces tanzawaensis NRRL Y-17324]ODV79647.1 clathrin adaptor, mu subunit [Suhomyces tanzawaensis NRRL Y-17324]
MVCAFYILFWPDSDIEYPHSQVLLNRRYRNDIPGDQSLIRNFENTFKKLPNEQKTPFIESNGITYTYIRGNFDILLMAVSVRNINAMLTILFLNQFYGTLCHYLCSGSNGQKLDKDTVSDNSMLIFDLLDECMDFGVIQVTDYNLLKEYIKIEANLPKLKQGAEKYSSDSEDESETSKSKSKSKSHKHKDIKSTRNQANKSDVMSDDNSVINSSILRTYSLAINWRPKGIFYAKNEIYIDIIEHCEFHYDIQLEKVKKNEIHGSCAVKCYLSGMPNCKIGFNEKYISSVDNEDFIENEEEPIDMSGNQLVIKDEDDDAEDEQETLVGEEDQAKRKDRIPIRDIQFHQCIQLGSIYKDNLVTFTPPDDKFTLMTYNVEQHKQKRKGALIMIKPTYRILSQSKKLQILCVLTTKFKKRLHCRNLLVRIPINPNIFDITSLDEDGLKYKTEMGEVSYKIDSSELVWSIDNITGKKAVKMMAELSLNSVTQANLHNIQNLLNHRFEEQTQNEEDDDDNITKELDTFYGVNGQSSSLASKILKKITQNNTFNNIKITFNIPMLSYSGLKITYLRVDEEQMKYTCFPWVRYITEATDNQVDEQSGRNNASHCDYQFKLAPSCFTLI